MGSAKDGSVTAFVPIAGPGYRTPRREDPRVSTGADGTIYECGNGRPGHQAVYQELSGARRLFHALVERRTLVSACRRTSDRSPLKRALYDGNKP